MTTAQTEARAIDALAARVERWKHNTDKGRVSIPIGEIRAALAAIEPLHRDYAALVHQAFERDVEISALTAQVERLTRERGNWEHQCGVNLQHYEAEKGLRRSLQAQLAALKKEEGHAE